MSILNAKLDQAGLADVFPRWIYLETDNTVAEVSATGYLNSLDKQLYPISDKMKALVSVKDSPNDRESRVVIMEVTQSGDDWSIELPQSHQIKYAGKKDDGGGSATIAITVTGVLATDVVFAQVEASTNAVEVQKVTPTADTITVLLSGDPGASTVISYQALRAVA